MSSACPPTMAVRPSLLFNSAGHSCLDLDPFRETLRPNITLTWIAVPQRQADAAMIRARGEKLDPPRDITGGAGCAASPSYSPSRLGLRRFRRLDLGRLGFDQLDDVLD